MSEAQPILRVIRGDATPEEIAALLAVIAARGRAAEGPPRRTPSAWENREYTMRSLPAPGPGAWRASAWPR